MLRFAGNYPAQCHNHYRILLDHNPRAAGGKTVQPKTCFRFRAVSAPNSPGFEHFRPHKFYCKSSILLMLHRLWSKNQIKVYPPGVSLAPLQVHLPEHPAPRGRSRSKILCTGKGKSLGPSRLLCARSREPIIRTAARKRDSPPQPAGLGGRSRRPPVGAG